MALYAIRAEMLERKTVSDSIATVRDRDHGYPQLQSKTCIKPSNCFKKTRINYHKHYKEAECRQHSSKSACGERRDNNCCKHGSNVLALSDAGLI